MIRICARESRCALKWKRKHYKEITILSISEGSLMTHEHFESNEGQELEQNLVSARDLMPDNPNPTSRTYTLTF